MATMQAGDKATLKAAIFAAFFLISSYVFADPEGEGWFKHGEWPAGNAHLADLYCDDEGKDFLGYVEASTLYEGGAICWRSYDKTPCNDAGIFDKETGMCDDGLPNCNGEGGSAIGSDWSVQSESCVCPEGQTDVFNPDSSYSCQTDIPECVAGSAQHVGWLNDTAVCDYNGFCGDGEAGGLVDTGSGTQWACMPDSCSGGTFINGSCISPDDTTADPQTDHNEDDTDGDGIPDSSDNDIDGDGINNSEDPDSDGDGVDDVDAPVKDKKGSATAVGGCEAPPVCSGGDPQICAILKQQWYSMCAGDDFQEPEQTEFTSEAQDRYDQSQQDFEDKLAAIGSEVSSYMSFDLNGGGGSLPEDSRSIFGQSVNFSISRFSSLLAPVGSVFYFACTLLAAYIILRK